MNDSHFPQRTYCLFLNGKIAIGKKYKPAELAAELTEHVSEIRCSSVAPSVKSLPKADDARVRFRRPHRRSLPELNSVDRRPLFTQQSLCNSENAIICKSKGFAKIWASRRIGLQQEQASVTPVTPVPICVTVQRVMAQHPVPAGV